MRDLHSNAMGLGSAPLNELPDQPSFIGSFEPLGGTPPDPNDDAEWAATHLPTVRLAYMMVNRPKANLVKLADPELNALEAVITSLQRSREVLQAYWMSVEVAMAGLSIVIGRNVLPED